MLNQIKLAPKLIGSYLFVALLLVVVAVIGYMSMHSINQNAVDIYKNEVVHSDHLKSAYTKLYVLRGDVYKFILLEKERGTIEQTIAADMAELDKNVDVFRNAEIVETEKKVLAQFDSAWTQYRQEVARVMDNVKAGDIEAATTSMGPDGAASNARKAVDAALEQLLEFNHAESE